MIWLVNCPHSGSSSTTASRSPSRIELKVSRNVGYRGERNSKVLEEKTSSVRGTTNSRRAWPPFAPREEKRIEKNRRSVFLSFAYWYSRFL